MKSQFLSPSSAPSTRHVSQACSSSASLTALVTLAPAALAAQGGNPGTHCSHASLPPRLRVPALLLLLSALGVLALSFSSATAQLAPPGTPIYETIRTFGQPSTGGEPEPGQAGLLLGADGALYGTTPTMNYGPYRGAVIRLEQDGSEFSVLHHFMRDTDGGSPRGRLVQGADGTLYGTCSEGGLLGFGTVYRLNPDGTGFTVLFHCGRSSGGAGGLILGMDGAIYGTSLDGGNFGSYYSDDGTVFRLNTDGSGLTILHHFNRVTDAFSPYAYLSHASDGALYGTTYAGGAFGHGTVFKLNVDGTGFAIILSSSSPITGGIPNGVIEGADGRLYGVASARGDIYSASNGDGTLFRLNKDGSGFTVLQAFSYFVTGSAPTGLLLKDSHGTLYGSNTRGGSYNDGTLFKVNPDGTGLSILKQCDYRTSGAMPVGGLIMGTDGAIYGMCRNGGTGPGSGTIFKLETDGSAYQVLKNLSRHADLTEEGGYPAGQLVQGSNGALYGTNGWGGNAGYGGTLYTINLDGSGFRVLKNFDPAITGRATPAGLIQATDGWLYGTTAQSLFRISLDGTGFAPVHQLFGPTVGELCQGIDGAFYGMLKWGGLYGLGGAYRILPNGQGYAALMDFSSESDPIAGFVQGIDGALYASTNGGAFKLNPNGSSSTLLNDLGGDAPASSLLLGVDGALYGTGYKAFRLNTDGTGYTVLQSFQDLASTGFSPRGGLIQGLDGMLYGTTAGGGLYDSGTLYRMNPDGTSFAVLHQFGQGNTSQKNRLLQASDGNLYGTTLEGGANFGGSVYRLIIGDMRINALSPRTGAGGSEGFTLTVEGFYFAEGAVVEWDGVPLPTQVVDGFTLTAEAPATAATLDLSTVRVTVRLADETVSAPELFIVTAGNVAEADGTLVEPGLSVSVSTAPVVAGSIGVSATLSNTGGEPATLTVANYTSDPSGTVFSAGGGFTDVQITGADLADTAAVSFYYPSTIDPATEAELSLMTYDGTGWITVRSNGDTAPVKNTADNLDGTVSGGRFTVVFGATSTPKITELGGTIFAMGTPYGFDGFLAPIGGADHASGGSFGDPLRTFKARSTIPVKFRASATGQPILTGVHTLRARKFSSRTTGDAPIDASPQGKATTGNRFELLGHHWQFNLDTKATGLTTGIWQLTATLADGSQHFVWIQIK